jgi:hypothetical protein
MKRLVLVSLSVLTFLLLISLAVWAEEITCEEFLGSITVDNLRVPQNASCRLHGTRVKGTIKVETGASLTTQQVRVGGNVQAEGAAVVNVLAGSTISGSIQIKLGGPVQIDGVLVNGDIQFESNYGVLSATHNQVGGSVQVFKNTGGVTIANNTIDGNLQCKENDSPPTGGNNIVNGNKEDQCAFPSAAGSHFGFLPVVARFAAGSPSDTTPPDTTITVQPPDPSSSGSASFGFTGSDDMTPPAALRFECRLDSVNEADFVACLSPQSYASLSAGLHTFAVRALDQAGNTDLTPASYTWTVSPSTDCGEPITVFADADSWIDQNSSSNNFGTDAILKVRSQGPNDNFRALVRFSLPASVPQGCIIQSAMLRLYAASWTDGRTLQAIRVGDAWAEDLITWSNQSQTTGPVATTSSGSGYREWSVAAQVQAMYDASANNGFLVRDAVESWGGSEQQFHSREKGENPPMLIISFGPAGG